MKGWRVNTFNPRGLAHEDRQLVRYLLGMLSDTDAERLDELSIVDDEIAARLRSIENDLVDAYVCGTLEGELRERFESFYLASPLRREKVKFARGFLNAVDRLPEAATTTTSVAPVPAPVSRRRKFIWLGSAAGLL